MSGFEYLGRRVDVDRLVGQHAVSEVARARGLFPDFHNAHEGYAVLLEEVDELWAEVKRGAEPERMEAEAIQIAAMAIRFVVDVCRSGSEVT